MENGEFEARPVFPYRYMPIPRFAMVTGVPGEESGAVWAQIRICEEASLKRTAMRRWLIVSPALARDLLRACGKEAEEPVEPLGPRSNWPSVTLELMEWPTELLENDGKGGVVCTVFVHKDDLLAALPRNERRAAVPA